MVFDLWSSPNHRLIELFYSNQITSTYLTWEVLCTDWVQFWVSIFNIALDLCAQLYKVTRSIFFCDCNAFVHCINTNITFNTFTERYLLTIYEKPKLLSHWLKQACILSLWAAIPINNMRVDQCWIILNLYKFQASRRFPMCRLYLTNWSAFCIIIHAGRWTWPTSRKSFTHTSTSLLHLVQFSFSPYSWHCKNGLKNDHYHYRENFLYRTMCCFTEQEAVQIFCEFCWSCVAWFRLMPLHTFSWYAFCFMSIIWV